jgi:hypothetical protein
MGAMSICPNPVCPRTKVLGQCVAWTSAEAEFLDVIGTKVLRGFLPCYSQSPQLTETQKPQRNCTFMNFASVVIIHPHLSGTHRSGTHRSGTHSQGIYVCIRTRCVCTVFVVIVCRRSAVPYACVRT